MKYINQKQERMTGLIVGGVLLLMLALPSFALQSKHQDKGVACAQCHGDGNDFAAVEKETCTGCHNLDQLVAKTAGMKPANPHTSPHYGPEADCNLCHHQHEESEDYCAQCHSFGFKVP